MSKYEWKENLELYTFLLPTLVLVFIFAYIPLYGLFIAFQDYAPGNPFFSLTGKVNWVGLKHFERFFSSIYFKRLFSNTLTLSFWNLLFGFPIPIIFAVLLNEVKSSKFKKVIQTSSYLPYFISTVVVAGMALSFLQTDGIFNILIETFGGSKKKFITDPSYFSKIYVITNIWKSFGFNSILYLSAITSVDQAQYESARIDGANRFHLMRYITLPNIQPTIAITFVMSIGSMLSSNTDLILLLYSPATYEKADVFGTYIYRIGINGGEFSYTTAITLISSTLNFLLLFLGNKFAKKTLGQGLW
jgi:putative aldouronate transport system permease protein